MNPMNWSRWNFHLRCCYCVLAALIIIRSVEAEGVVTRKVHFMVEFIPFSRVDVQENKSDDSNNSDSRCQVDEIRIIQDFIAEVIHQDTGFSKRPHREKFLDGYYNDGKHPGFDVTYECPDTCDDFPTAWCEILCDDNEARVRELGHEPLDRVAMDLKNRIHKTSRGHDAMFAVKCLGDITQVELHLVVSTSPYQPKISYDLEMSRRRASATSEL